MSEIEFSETSTESTVSRKKPMSAAEFEAFVKFAAVRFNWSARKLADALGISEKTMTAWRRNGAPRHVGLACGAIAYGLPAWRRVSAQ